MKLAGILVFLFAFASAPSLPAAAAATQYVTVSPGNINLGMTTTVNVTAPAAGSYTVVVNKPGGTSAQLPVTFTAAGQVQSLVFGNASLGFKSEVTKAGTYEVLLQQGSQTVYSASFYATDQILITTGFITGGQCLFVASATRGTNLLFQIHAVYASNGKPIAYTANQSIANGDKVTYTLPDGTIGIPTIHAATNKTWPVPWFQGRVWGNWNASWVGPYYPVVMAVDKWGNTGKLDMSKQGYTFMYTPAALDTAVQLTDATTGKLVTGLASAQKINITATIAYVINPSTITAVAGFKGPLDATRGGVVTAKVGWGFYNTTTNTFGGGKQAGGLITTANLTWSATKKAWTGQFSTGALPTLVNATAYTVIVGSRDKASPPNVGSATLSVPPATMVAGGLPQVTTSTVTSTTTALSTISSTISSISTTTTTTVSVAVSTLVQTAESVPAWSYAVMLLLLLVGLPLGYLLKRQRST